MPEPVNKILIFGPSGQVARVAAIEARKRGAEVWLAMRDPSKSIDGLSEDDGFTRVTADLSKPDTIKSAVSQCRARTAFVYTIWESNDHMRASFEVLKEAGVKYIVLLSAFSVQGSPNEDRNRSHFLVRLHSDTEIALEDSGVPYTTVRPAYFSSNLFGRLEEVKKGEVEVFSPAAQYDWIATEDIGAAVCALLTQKTDHPPKEVYLCGPQLLTEPEALQILAQKIGKKLRVKEITEDAFREKMKMQPTGVTDAMVAMVREMVPPQTMYEGDIYESAISNVQKYAGKKPLTFHDWVDRHMKAFG